MKNGESQSTSIFKNAFLGFKGRHSSLHEKFGFSFGLRLVPPRMTTFLAPGPWLAFAGDCRPNLDGTNRTKRPGR